MPILRPAAAMASLLLAAVLGCAHQQPVPPAPDPRLARPYRSGPLPERARVFLVAGGHDSANFAQEIVDQRRLWRRAGLDDDEIACYWAKPTNRAWAKDARQYRRLLDDLADCWPASARVLRQHLRVAAEHEPPFVYLYVTSHGTRSLLASALASSHIEVARSAADLSSCERDLLDRPTVSLDAELTGGSDALRVIAGLRAGEDPDDLILTPTALRSSLARFSPATPKVVVLQACYSGGFIDEDGDRSTVDGLAGIAGLTVLTAARYDRSSFGCGTGARTTAFGGAYDRVLSHTHGLGDPASVAWDRVLARTRARVERRERRAGLAASYPAYYRAPLDLPRTTPRAPCRAPTASGG